MVFSLKEFAVKLCRELLIKLTQNAYAKNKCLASLSASRLRGLVLGHSGLSLAPGLALPSRAWLLFCCGYRKTFLSSFSLPLSLSSFSLTTTAPPICLSTASNSDLSSIPSLCRSSQSPEEGWPRRTTSGPFLPLCLLYIFSQDRLKIHLVDLRCHSRKTRLPIITECLNLLISPPRE